MSKALSTVRMAECFGLLVAMSITLTAEARLPLPRLKVSDNKRFLVKEDGQPFFWLGDTAWELFHRLNRAEAEKYLANRAERGFTVVQAVVIAELNGYTVPNPNGYLPLVDLDPARPAVKDGKPLFTPENAETYGRWLGQRYRDKGIVWILGGDWPIENDIQREIIRAMARGLRQGDGGTHLITLHPPGGNGSSSWFQNDDRLDFNLRQNGHVTEYTGRYDQTIADYDRTPVKPVIDGEPIYEDHPISFDAKRFGHSIAADVRRPLYWDLFSGACGHTYGNHAVWQMRAPGRPPINNPLMPWFEAINQPGAAQMQFARWLLESRPFLTRVPDDSVIVTDRVPTSVPGAGRYRFVATRDAEGSYAMVYAPVGRKFKVHMDKVTGPQVKAWWFNPRNGEAAAIGEFPNTGEREFTPPIYGELLDRVLVLDSAARHFPPPGHRAK